MTTMPAIMLFLTAFFAIKVLHADDKMHYRAQIKVSSSDKTQGEIISYLSREFRKVGDIDLVEDDSWFTISVIALGNTNINGAPTGYTLSVLVDRPVKYANIRRVLAEKYDETALKGLDVSLTNSTQILTHFVQAGPADGLENICKKIVAQIDGTIFEEQRKLAQQVKDLIGKNGTLPVK